MKTVCPQCHTDGHHKMSCSDESNPGRKDRMNLNMSLKEPIVEGAYYERDDGSVVGPAASKGNGWWELSGYWYKPNGLSTALPRVCGYDLRCRVYLVPTDPVDVVAELRQCKHGSSNPYMAGIAVGYNNAADIVAKKLGVES